MADTLAYIGRRLIQLFLVIWVAGTINFIIPRLIPGDPVAGRAGLDRGPRRRPEHRRHRPDQGLEREVRLRPADLRPSTSTTGSTSRTGDLGVSIANFPQPVTQKIAAAIPWTIGLLGVATIIAFLIGTFAGALVAWPQIAADRAHHRATVPAVLADPVLPAGDPADLRLRGHAQGSSRRPAGSAPRRSSDSNVNSVVDITTHAFLPGAVDRPRGHRLLGPRHAQPDGQRPR